MTSAFRPLMTALRTMTVPQSFRHQNRYQRSPDKRRQLCFLMKRRAAHDLGLRPSMTALTRHDRRLQVISSLKRSDVISSSNPVLALAEQARAALILRAPSANQSTATNSKEVVISAVLPSMIEAEQYFS